MDLTLVLSLITTTFLLILLPGPDFIMVLTESITKGKKHGITLAFSLSSGIILHTLLIASGVSIILQKSDIAFLIIKIFGALYLFYLAYISYQDPSNRLELNKHKIKAEYSFFKLFKKGFFANVLNPKVMLFFIAFLPQFVCKTCSFSFTKQLIILGCIIMLQSFIVFTGIAILADKLAQFITSEKFWKNIKWAQVIIYVGIGIFLLT